MKKQKNNVIKLIQPHKLNVDLDTGKVTGITKCNSLEEVNSKLKLLWFMQTLLKLDEEKKNEKND